jgi:hypothetical protein
LSHMDCEREDRLVVDAVGCAHWVEAQAAEAANTWRWWTDGKLLRVVQIGGI